MPKIDNMLAILWMLRSNQKITAQQISEKLELNIRTVYRYIDALSTSGVPIVSEPGHHGGYSILDHFKETPLFFDAEEQASLIHAANFAENAGYYGGVALERAISKLGNYVNEKQESQISRQVSSLDVIKGLRSSPLESSLNELERAVVESVSVKIQYPSKSEAQRTDRLIDPYKILFWNTKWYVIGFCHLRNEPRSFRVDRIESLIVTEHPFNEPEHFSARDFFMKNLLPNLSEERVESVLIQGEPKVLDDLCRHWFLSHYVQARDANQAFFLLEQEMINTFVPYLLLPYGTSIRVLAPSSLQKSVIDVLNKLLHFHQS
ncbi:YafY family protein [Sporosarcina sp. Te-1]|uniref:helix-turn-helix transcriptional regulator n=1 Tax=Sporosarcina sp. Te-1 TaxID=2818390 RepID=UPI001A9E1E57|nr:YafY family protein [Sporosarcina sp. Te-1]QTD41893.1 YafY family transcriptional regulator [Sporosarcina sp. Te-1]